MIFINVRHLIKRILREETQKDLSPKIKKLLDDSVKPNHKLICRIDVVAPWKLIGNNSTSDYQVMVSVIGGAGSKNWPMTQFVHGSRDKVVNDVWQTVYDYMGIPTDVFLRTVKTCDEVMSESTIPNTIKRRANTKTLQDYITKGEINYPTLCDDFEDGYEYADKVIDYAIDEFMYEIDDNIDDEDHYSDVMDYLRTVCRNEFGEELIRIYNKTCIENTKEEQNESVSKRQKFDFQQLVDNGVLWITQPHVNGQRVKPNWKGDSNVITLWNIEHPEEGQEWVQAAIKHPKPEAIEWWTQNGQDTLSDAKYNQILRSIKLVDSQSKNEFTEGEITERCWKGYTQKGMKTMFGKRYPNCVKIKKKKRMNESKIMDYLKQFLSGEVLDNYKKEKGRKEFQKLVDIVYKITAKDNPIEGMVGVLVGNINKEMWGRNFNDDKSVGQRWDFNVILKPLFTEYNPNNDPDYNERVLNFQKEFVDNARGMGFEAISPIQHPKISNYRVSFEWASRLDVDPI